VSGAPGSAWQDGRGCLTASGLQAVRGAVPGQAPAELAAHLAGCVRCQEKLLALDAPRRGASRRRATSPELPSLGRGLVMALLMVAAIVAALLTLRQLVPH
jgi:hypothetical protein